MKLLLVREQGRAAARRAGGIYRSGQAIQEALVARGWEVLTHRDKTSLAELPAVDVVWHYGAYSELDSVVEKALAAGTPIVVNSSYNTTPNITQWMLTQWAKWDKSPLFFFSVWSHLPLFDPALGDLRKQLVMLPKTLRLGSKNLPLRARRGIALGDMVKLQMRELVAGMDIPRVVARLREAFPEEPLLSFEQHNHGWEPIKGVELVPYQTDLPTWLGERKIFLSLVVAETYAMVPMEAQSVGTPVIYRHQPQSLTQTIGQTGILVRDEDDLIEAVGFLLGDPAAWQAYNEVGLLNARSHQHFAVGMDLGLRSVVRRSRG